MAKAPAFQLYYDRFNSSTSLWDDAQVGKYLRLLICQANKRYVTAKELKKVVPDDDPEILAKFKEIEPGKFINSVLEEVLIERDNFQKKQAENGVKGGRPEKPKQNPNETQTEPKINPTINPTNNPEHNPNETSISTSTPNTTIETNFTPTTKKNTANAVDLFFNDRVEIIKELNELTGRNFEPHAAYVRKDIDARLKQGFTVDDHKKVIQVKSWAWLKKPEMKAYLRPQTLFCAKHFEDYLQEAKDHEKNGTRPHSEPINDKIDKHDLGARVKELYYKRGN